MWVLSIFLGELCVLLDWGEILSDFEKVLLRYVGFGMVLGIFVCWFVNIYLCMFYLDEKFWGKC